MEENEDLPEADPSFDPDQLLVEIQWMENFNQAKDELALLRAAIACGDRGALNAVIAALMNVDADTLRWFTLAAVAPNLTWDTLKG